MPARRDQVHRGPSDDLRAIIDEAAELLPGQGPITVFIHHNTLHAFEGLDFEDAVVRAGELFGCEPFASEEFYRAALERGRITAADVEAVLAETLGARGHELVAAGLTRRALRSGAALVGFPRARGPALAWLLGETDALAGPRAELWAACRAAIERSSFELPSVTAPARVRHRDLILAASGIDIDAWIHPVLIRFVSAFLDQGVAHWPLAGRERGLYACFVELFDGAAARWCGPWARRLPEQIVGERRCGGAALASIEASLAALGVGEDRREFLSATALALRGFAGMIRQLEDRPDRVPSRAVPATLVDFLAVRLILERVAIEHVATTRFGVSSAALRGHLDGQAQPREPADGRGPPSVAERAWPLVELASRHGLAAETVAALGPEEIAALERELFEFDELGCRKLLHLAYERHLRQHFYDALIQHRPTPTPAEPRFMAMFCIDEREESIRRHLEELAPEVETFGAAGFYGVAMYYRGATDAHPRPLSPVALRPQHYVAEQRSEGRDVRARLRRLRRRGLGIIGKNVHLGSHTLFRGALVMTAIGALAIVPLVLRVMVPGLRPRVARLEQPGPPTRLAIERSPDPPPLGRFAGYEIAEMAEIVAVQLENVGVVDRLAPLVFVIGHGSISLNNPHESAHDCGACGGGRGGPNARAFAQMANDPRVRAALVERGIAIPSQTWFIGGERNTADNSLTLFDLDLVPASLRAALDHARRRFELARGREAHERCRRFEHARPGWSARAALRHVEARASDLAQPRPEYGHASNAVCFIGRRARTRGLFLDRRAFLVSYDPSCDPDATILARLLAAGVPVIAGISLEYYFSYVDPSGYGSGTKLPHNVTGLLGVMDGAQSDLRTGLPWQMVEIHEPVRMTIVVESKPEALARVIAANPTLTRLVSGRWLTLACLDPDSSRLWEHGAAGFEERRAVAPLARARGSSRTVYAGRRGHLPFVGLTPDREGQA